MTLRYFIFLFAVFVSQVNHGGIKERLNVWREWIRTHPKTSIFSFAALIGFIGLRFYKPKRKNSRSWQEENEEREFPKELKALYSIFRIIDEIKDYESFDSLYSSISKIAREINIVSSQLTLAGLFGGLSIPTGQAKSLYTSINKRIFGTHNLSDIKDILTNPGNKYKRNVYYIFKHFQSIFIKEINDHTDKKFEDIEFLKKMQKIIHDMIRNIQTIYSTLEKKLSNQTEIINTIIQDFRKLNDTNDGFFQKKIIDVFLTDKSGLSKYFEIFIDKKIEQKLSDEERITYLDNLDNFKRDVDHNIYRNLQEINLRKSIHDQDQKELYTNIAAKMFSSLNVDDIKDENKKYEHNLYNVIKSINNIVINMYLKELPNEQEEEFIKKIQEDTNTITEKLLKICEVFLKTKPIEEKYYGVSDIANYVNNENKKFNKIVGDKAKRLLINKNEE